MEMVKNMKMDVDSSFFIWVIIICLILQGINLLISFFLISKFKKGYLRLIARALSFPKFLIILIVSDKNM